MKSQFLAQIATMAQMSGMPMPKLSMPTPKKPWQTRSDYLKKGNFLKNPKQANHVNMMFNKHYGEKFGYTKTDFK